MTTNRNDSTNRNRAEQLRQRKTQQNRPHANDAAIPTRHSTYENVAQARPVLVRNATFGTPVRQRVATTNPRKQFYVPLNSPGTELRLPALPTFHLGARAVSGMLALFTAIGILSVLFSPLFAVETTQVSGLVRLTQANIDAALNIQNLSVVELDPKALREELLATYPMLENASVSVGLPNQVKVAVTERQPILAWNVGEKSLWIDKKGVVFQPTGEVPDLMVISADAQPPLFISPEERKALAISAQTASTTGTVPPLVNQDAALTLKNLQPGGEPDRIDPVLLTTAQKLAAHLPAGTALTYTAASGLGWKDSGGWEVYIGINLDQFDQKFALYQSISAELASQGITPALISVEFLNSPYYRLEK